MSLTLNAAEARQADRVNTSIKESGKYIGVITRAEKIMSKKNTEGFGLSFKADDGSTANYLDLYTVNEAGETLPSMATVQAILCCTRTKEAKEGNVEFEKWDGDAKAIVKANANGYPELMGKRIGLILQRELSINTTNGKDVDRVVIYGVFEADSELTASEILDKKTQPEKVAKMVSALKAVNDRRTGASNQSTKASHAAEQEFDDVPF